jgi:hypothetical protein
MEEYTLQTLPGFSWLRRGSIGGLHEHGDEQHRTPLLDEQLSIAQVKPCTTELDCFWFSSCDKRDDRKTAQ